MSELITYLITCSMADLETLLGDMYQPAVACIVALVGVLPAVCLVECVTLLVRLLSPGGGKNG